MGVMHDFRGQEGVNDREQKDERRDEVKGFPANSIGELIENRLAGVVVGIYRARQRSRGRGFGGGKRDARQKGENKKAGDGYLRF